MAPRIWTRISDAILSSTVIISPVPFHISSRISDPSDLVLATQARPRRPDSASSCCAARTALRAPHTQLPPALRPIMSATIIFEHTSILCIRCVASCSAIMITSSLPVEGDSSLGAADTSCIVFTPICKTCPYRLVRLPMQHPSPPRSSWSRFPCRRAPQRSSQRDRHRTRLCRATSSRCASPRRARCSSFSCFKD